MLEPVAGEGCFKARGADGGVACLMQGKTIHYSAERIIGNGSFGVVFQVRSRAGISRPVV